MRCKDQIISSNDFSGPKRIVIILSRVLGNTNVSPICGKIE